MVDNNFQNIKWMLFDLSGVLVPFTFVHKQWYQYKSRYFEAKDLERVFSDKDYMSYMKGELSHEQAISRYIQKKHLDLSVDEFNELVKLDQRPMEGMVDLLKKLEKKYKIALATNEGKVTMMYKIEASGLLPYVTKIVPSYLLRELKPDKQYFLKLLTHIKAKPQECFFIDDTKKNVDAAISLGIRSVVFTTTQKLINDLAANNLL